MRRDGPVYRDYLEALALSLLAERERRGQGEFEVLAGVDAAGAPAHYSPYNAKEAIGRARADAGLPPLVAAAPPAGAGGGE